MAVFEFITISNGVAVVQHAPSGYVYRFRPVRPGLWGMLTLDTVDAADLLGTGPDDYLGAAQAFAEDVASSICRAAADGPHIAAQASLKPRLSISGLPRRLGQN